MNKSPERGQLRSGIALKPVRRDALVALAVLALAVLCGLRFWLAPGQSGKNTVVVRIDGVEAERLPFSDAERTYQNNGYTVHIAVSAAGVRVTSADCPTQDCVRTGRISRAGQSIVCLPARVVVTVEGAAEAGYDVVVG